MLSLRRDNKIFTNPDTFTSERILYLKGNSVAFGARRMSEVEQPQFLKQRDTLHMHKVMWIIVTKMLPCEDDSCTKINAECIHDETMGVF